jgi:polysaccharide biosynthesis protein PelE
MLTRGAACSLLLGCGFVAFDAALLVAFYTEALDWPMALAAHLAVSLVLTLSGLRGAARGGPGAERYRVRLHFATWAVLLGPFGGLIGMMLFMPKASPEARVTSGGIATPPGAERDAAPSRLEALHNTLLDSRLRLGGGNAVRPLLDIVIEGTAAEKLDALGLVARHYVPALAPTLRRALRNADCSVRVLAATAMAQLHNGHTRRIGALQDLAQAASTSAAWRTLGEARLAYAASGLLESDRARDEADEGRTCLARADALEPAGAKAPAHPAPEGAAADAALEALCHAA